MRMAAIVLLMSLGKHHKHTGVAIQPVVGDFAGGKALNAIGSFVRSHDGTIDIFYVSNVESYLFEDGKVDAFYRNLRALPVSDNTLIVRTFFGSALRACPATQVSTRVPLAGRIDELLAAHQGGDIMSICSLIGRSR